MLASALRVLNRPEDALAHVRESLAAYELIEAPLLGDLYNMACDCATLATLDAHATPADRETLLVRGVGYLRTAVEGNTTLFLPLIPGDPDLDPLRTRTEFQGLMADAIFPRDPFAPPSSLASIASLSPEEQRQLDGFSEGIARQPGDFRTWRARGDFFARRGEWTTALADFRKALAANPPTTWVESGFDNQFALDSAVVLILSGDLDGCRRLARAMLDQFPEAKDPAVTDAIAKVNSLMPPPAQDLGRVERFAQRSVDEGEGSGIFTWCLLARGMAAYRTGEYAAAVQWLEKAGQSDIGPDHRSAWKSFLAMVEFRLGHAGRARTLLAEAGELIAARSAQRVAESAWHNLRIAEMARREDEALIHPATAQAAEGR